MRGMPFDAGHSCHCPLPHDRTADLRLLQTPQICCIAPDRYRAYGAPGLNSWSGKVDASGALITTKGWSAVAWQLLQPAVSFS